MSYHHFIFSESNYAGLCSLEFWRFYPLAEAKDVRVYYTYVVSQINIKSAAETFLVDYKIRRELRA